MDVQVRRFEEHEWQIYRSLRMAALDDSPDAFGSTSARSAVIPDSEWQRRLQDIHEDRDCPLIALVDGKPGGLAWGTADEDDVRRVHLFQMWVVPYARELGVGRQLVDAFIAWARLRFDVAELGVTCGNTAAQQLYQGAGFEAVGETEPLREESDLMTQKMELRLR